MTTPKRLGLIVNPIAGMGGRVGLKGTDGAGAVEKAMALGATPVSPERAQAALAVLLERTSGEITLVTPAGAMGEDVCRALGIEAIVIGAAESDATGPADTRRAARTI